MQTTARIPSIRAARATPCAWFPAEEQTTPRSRSSSESSDSLFSGPRILYEPVRWNISAFRRTSSPVSSESVREAISGVRWMKGATFSRAATESGSALMLTGRLCQPTARGGLDELPEEEDHEHDQGGEAEDDERHGADREGRRPLRATARSRA